ncbi:NACHT, LRR and PYD domains-containing protein 3-like [Xenia sp. Carnegie-2017]|uniref:NACHT, LRR and PYD domains-containing protein 3-like n=1 Tax=Xenia sp. Carnegie-2017 TaxID=2897299 RepID=UPI001F04AC4A|nr:NACHT, LRR and PYD domains-containing protein 3-like [Xenia sp. Carnegie-2017]
MARKDRFFMREKEFCVVYLLRKHKRIRKWSKQIKKQSRDYKTPNEFNDESTWKNFNISVKVIIKAENLLEKAYPKTCKRHEIFHYHLKTDECIQNAIKATEIFGEIQERSILVIGRAGIGKTVLTRKLMHEWKHSKEEFWQDKLVVLIRCCALKKGYNSVKDMLSECDKASNQDFEQIYQFIQVHPEKTLLLIDGVDELDNDELEQPYVKTVFTWLSDLVGGKLLPDATVLITSRPTAENRYRMLPFDRTVEIVGFFDDQIKKCVNKISIENNDFSHQIINCIESSLELICLCYIPANTKMICQILNENFRKELEVPKTITEVYKRALIEFYNDPCENDMNEIKHIAYNRIDGRSLIYEKDASDPRILKTSSIFHEIPRTGVRLLFCFDHLTLQEFLAAKHVVEDEKNIEKFLEDNCKNPKWHLVIQFVAGLVGDMKRSETNTKKLTKDIEQRFEKWISHLFRDDGDKALGFLGMKCLYEMQDIDVIKSACTKLNSTESNIVEIRNVSFTPLDSFNLCKFISKCGHIEKIVLISCKFDKQSCLELENNCPKRHGIIVKA